MLDDKIKVLNLESEIFNKLTANGILLIKDLWILKRNDLKTLKFNDHEIRKIIIKLELKGLDLNKKMYN